MTDIPERAPIFNAPRIVILTIAFLAAVHGARLLLAEETDFRVLLGLALIPGRALVAEDLPGGELAVYAQYLTHMMLHGDIAHLGINAAWLLIFGTIVARRLSTLRFLILLVASGLAGAAAFVISHPGEMQPMIGASGAVSGLMGAVIRLVFSADDLGGPRILEHYAKLMPRMRLARAIQDRRVLGASAAIVGINLLLATSFGGFLSGGGIAWEAHLGGYFFGLLAFGLIDDGPVEPPRRHVVSDAETDGGGSESP